MDAPFTDSSLGYLTNRLARLFALAAQRRLAPLGVNPGQLPTLLQLYERENHSQAELARTIGLEQPTMANTLQRMERDGLVERRPDPDDGRRALIRLTARGRDLESSVRAQLQAANAAAAADLPTEQIRQFLHAVTKMIANLEADRDALPPDAPDAATSPGAGWDGPAPPMR